jgi:hypothetical protein
MVGNDRMKNTGLRHLRKRMCPSAIRAAFDRTVACRKWIRKGRTLPPPHCVKQKTVLSFRKKFRLSVFIETGTYLGEMVEAARHSFERVYSIELSNALHRRAVSKFEADPHVFLVQGDSGERLKEVLDQLDRPALFWLDGHYSGGNTAMGKTETPIVEELRLIFLHPRVREHVILIDDARLFIGQGDYPSIDRLRRLAECAGMKVFEVKDDIIRMHAGMGRRP